MTRPPSFDDRVNAALVTIVTVVACCAAALMARDVLAERDAGRALRQSTCEATNACRINGGTPVATDYGWRCVYGTEVK